MSMRSLAIGASLVVATVMTLFIVAWESAGQAGEKYRGTVKTIAAYPAALITAALGWLCFLAIALIAPFDQRPVSKRVGSRWYLFRRSYRGEHRNGIPALRLITGAVAG